MSKARTVVGGRRKAYLVTPDLRYAFGSYEGENMWAVMINDTRYGNRHLQIAASHRYSYPSKEPLTIFTRAVEDKPYTEGSTCLAGPFSQG